jgi:hypothetical protein
MKRSEIKWILNGTVLYLNKDPSKTMTVTKINKRLNEGLELIECSFVGVTPEGETVEWNYKICNVKGFDVR